MMNEKKGGGMKVSSGHSTRQTNHGGCKRTAVDDFSYLMAGMLVAFLIVHFMGVM